MVLQVKDKMYVYDDYSLPKLNNAITLTSLDDIQNLNLECVILSPGVQVLNNKNIELFELHHINYVSEFYLGYLYCLGKKICITGTNGKTTTVNILYQMCKSKYKSIFLCGNTSIPITKVANMTNKDTLLICEVSSFQLECSPNLKPYISAILNITNDHISRHLNFENYFNTKLNITKYQNNNESILNQGNLVHEVAKYLFKDHINIEYTENLNQMISDTYVTIESYKKIVITEASLSPT